MEYELYKEAMEQLEEEYAEFVDRVDPNCELAEDELELMYRLEYLDKNEE